MATGDREKLYRVLKVTPTVIYSDGGKPTDGQRIDFTVTGAGDQYILIPNSDFDPDKIDAQVGDWAAKIAAVLSIEGPDVVMDQYGRPMPVTSETSTPTL